MPSTVAAIVLDIEGTTTPISFVHSVLFPYAIEHLDAFLSAHASVLRHPESDIVRAFRLQVEQDHAAGNPFHSLDIPSSDADNLLEILAENTRRWTAADRKIGALKLLQGRIWKSGFEAGDIQGPVYVDVVKALKTWNEQGVSVWIYSSGSVEAQQLLFGHSNQGNLLPYLKGHFDTNIGAKIAPESYERISREIQVKPEDILFLSDNPKGVFCAFAKIQWLMSVETRAAKDAGWNAVIVVRPGNNPLTDQDKHDFRIVESFDALFE